MFAMSSRLCGVMAVCALVLGSGAVSCGAAFAATLQVTSFDRGQIAEAQAALAAFQAGTDGSAAPGQGMQAVRTENFDGLAAWDGLAGAADPTTAVGRFSSLGGRGTGSSAIAGGTSLQVRDEAPSAWGRFGVGGPDAAWLDSNDTLGMRWEVGGLSSFNAIAFLLTDVSDVGARFSIRVGDTLFPDLLGASGRLANGSIQLVRILLPETVTGLAIELANSRLNDGFGLDGATIGRIAPIPLPPAALLLLSSAAALLGFGRRAGGGLGRRG